MGQFAFLIAVSVYAYNVGGERAVGLIFLARLVPAALVAPFAGMLGDRYPRERVLLYTNLTESFSSRLPLWACSPMRTRGSCTPFPSAQLSRPHLSDRRRQR